MSNLTPALWAIGCALALWTATPAHAQDDQATKDQAHAEAVQLWNELQAGIQDGTLTQAQATERLNEYRVSLGLPPIADRRQPPAQQGKQGQRGPKPPRGEMRRPEDAKKGFDAAVRAGRLTQAEADENWKLWQRNYERRKQSGQARPVPAAEGDSAPPSQRDGQRGGQPAEPDLAALRERLQAAVQNGDLTQDQARQRLLAFQRKQQQGGDSEQALQKILERYQTARRDGTLSTAEALRILEPLRRHLDALQGNAEQRPQAKRGPARPRQAQATQPAAGARAPQATGERDAAPAAKRPGKRDLPAQIEALVEAGRLTPLQAKARLEVHRRAQEQKERADREAAARQAVESSATAELDAKIEAINADVREQRLSREEAFARIQELREEATRAKIARDAAARRAAERKSFQARLQAGLRAGQLTTAEAAKRLEAFDKRDLE